MEKYFNYRYLALHLICYLVLIVLAVAFHNNVVGIIIFLVVICSTLANMVIVIAELPKNRVVFSSLPGSVLLVLSIVPFDLAFAGILTALISLPYVTYGVTHLVIFLVKWVNYET